MKPITMLIDSLRARRLRIRASQLAALAFDPSVTVYPTELRIPEPGRRSVLVITPHADDETFGAGGTLALHADAGDAVTVVLLSDNAPSIDDGRMSREEKERVREAEFRAAMNALGVGRVLVRGIPSGAFDVAHVRDALRTVFIENLHDVLYLPSMFDNHHEHRIVNSAVAELFPRGDAPALVRGFEVWSPLPATAVVDITPVVDRKIAAIRQYASQLSVIEYEHHIIGLNAYRAITLAPGKRYAEAFLQLRGDAYRALTTRTLTL